MEREVSEAHPNSPLDPLAGPTAATGIFSFPKALESRDPGWGGDQSLPAGGRGPPRRDSL